MKVYRQLLISLAVCLVLASASYGQAWKGIVPLRSTRADVERAIGKPTESNGLTYDLKTERVTVLYAGVRCETGWPYGWNVDPDVVIAILVYPKVKLTLAELGIDVTDYKKTQNIRLGGADYTNKDTGISIGLNSQGDVEVIQVEPTSNDNTLLCPDAAARQQEIERGESAYISPVVHYSNVSGREENTRIDYFVDLVKTYPANSKIYVFGYAGPKECTAEVSRRLARVRNRIASRLRIKPERVVAINDGRKSTTFTELYVVRPDEPRPLTTPERGPALIPKGNCGTPQRPKR